MVNTCDNHIIISDLPIGKTLSIDNFIEKAKIFMDVHDLWLDDTKEDDETRDKKPLGKRIIRLCPTLKHLLNIHVDHKASMAFCDFIELSIR